MEDHPMQLLLYGTAKFPGILPNPINTNINFRRYRMTGIGKIKGDDIGVVVVLQVGFVDFQQGLVGTKDIFHCCKGLPFLPEQGGKEQLQPPALGQRETGVGEVKADAGTGRG